ncbi:MAG: hypothetical protein ACTSQY_09205 [Candidatus Odinarchaeia archaeon]
MNFDSIHRDFWRYCTKSKIKNWGGSKGLLIPNSINFPKGPVILIEEKNKLEVFFVGTELKTFVSFIKKQLKNVLKDNNGKLLHYNKISEKHFRRILIAVKAMEHRALNAGEYVNDSEEVRELFETMASSIKKHLEIFVNTTHPTNKVYHLSRLNDELDNALRILNRIA